MLGVPSRCDMVLLSRTMFTWIWGCGFIEQSVRKQAGMGGGGGAASAAA